MKRPTAVRLSIPQPCHARWADMTPTERGRFCASCQKEVIDFTQMTPTEVAAHYAHVPHKQLCVRLRPDQLTQYSLPPLGSARLKYAGGRGLVVAALATVLLAPVASAAPPNPYLTEHAADNHDPMPDLPGAPIRGRVLAQDSTALAGVAVSLTSNGSCVGFTTTDDQGYFTLNMRAGAQLAPGATLRFSISGYRVLEMGLSAYQAQRKPEVLLASDMTHTNPDFLLGEVDVDYFSPED